MGPPQNFHQGFLVSSFLGILTISSTSLLIVPNIPLLLPFDFVSLLPPPQNFHQGFFFSSFLSSSLPPSLPLPYRRIFSCIDMLWYLVYSSIETSFPFIYPFPVLISKLEL